jgi:hypothetical protein
MGREGRRLRSAGAAFGFATTGLWRLASRTLLENAKFSILKSGNLKCGANFDGNS